MPLTILQEMHRNVLSRAERIEKLKEEERWDEGDAVLGLPKVAHRKTDAGRKDADDKKGDEEAVDVDVDAAAAETETKE